MMSLFLSTQRKISVTTIKYMKSEETINEKISALELYSPPNLWASFHFFESFPVCPQSTNLANCPPFQSAQRFGVVAVTTAYSFRDHNLSGRAVSREASRLRWEF